MTRSLRHLDQADLFHVFNRGADGQDIFSRDSDRHLFQALIAECAEAAGVAVLAFALMTNHFHLLVHAPDDRLSTFMHLLTSRYGAAYNQRTQRSGPLFGGRFGHVPITTDDHLLTEARYVERNPLAFVPPAALPNYVHSSLGVYLGVRAAPAWLSTDLLAGMMDQSSYLSFVLGDHESDIMARPGLGAIRPVPVTAIVEAVRSVTSIDPAQRSGLERNIALAVAVELRASPVRDLADAFGISPAGVRQAARRGRVSIATDSRSSSVRAHVLDRLRHAA